MFVLEYTLNNDMPRPRTIDDARLLAAAREVFLEKGISGTTAEVARRAGVAEGSLFHRFGSKADLFRAAILPAGTEPAWIAALAGRVGAGTIDEQLDQIAHEMIAFFRQILPLIMMSWSNPSPAGLPAYLTQPNAPPLLVIKRLIGYFEAEMRLGRLRRHDPEILARAFLGGVQNYVFFEVILRAQEVLPLPEATFVRGLVRLLLTGAAPDTLLSAHSSQVTTPAAAPAKARSPRRGAKS
jgi:AcrR family transcriptional regulator